MKEEAGCSRPARGRSLRPKPLGRCQPREWRVPPPPDVIFDVSQWQYQHELGGDAAHRASGSTASTSQVLSPCPGIKAVEEMLPHPVRIAVRPLQTHSHQKKLCMTSQEATEQPMYAQDRSCHWCQNLRPHDKDSLSKGTTSIGTHASAAPLSGACATEGLGETLRHDVKQLEANMEGSPTAKYDLETRVLEEVIIAQRWFALQLSVLAARIKHLEGQRGLGASGQERAGGTDAQSERPPVARAQDAPAGCSVASPEAALKRVEEQVAAFEARLAEVQEAFKDDLERFGKALSGCELGLQATQATVEYLKLQVSTLDEACRALVPKEGQPCAVCPPLAKRMMLRAPPVATPIRTFTRAASIPTLDQACADCRTVPSSITVHAGVSARATEPALEHAQASPSGHLSYRTGPAKVTVTLPVVTRCAKPLAREHVQPNLRLALSTSRTACPKRAVPNTPYMEEPSKERLALATLQERLNGQVSRIVSSFMHQVQQAGAPAHCTGNSSDAAGSPSEVAAEGHALPRRQQYF